MLQKFVICNGHTCTGSFFRYEMFHCLTDCFEVDLAFDTPKLFVRVGFLGGVNGSGLCQHMWRHFRALDRGWHRRHWLDSC